jgi:hypothetical protein
VSALLKLVPAWLWAVLAALAAVGYLSLRLDSVKGDRAAITAERDTATARVDSLTNTLRLQREITNDINRVSDDAKAKTEQFRLPLLLLITGLAACSSKSQTSSPSESRVLPRLPAEARQEPTLPFCSPTCVEALTKKREDWQKRLTEAE